MTFGYQMAGVGINPDTTRQCMVRQKNNIWVYPTGIVGWS